MLPYLEAVQESEIDLAAMLAQDSQIRDQRRYFQAEKKVRSQDILSGSLTFYSRGSMPIVIDASVWQRTTNPDGTIGTGVNWAALAKNRQFAGGYCKIGQPYGSEKAMMSKFCDNWFDPTWNPNFTGMHVNGLWRGGYIYHDTGWPLNRGMAEKGFDSIWDGTIEEVANKLIHEDPNLYVLTKTAVPGIGRVFDAAMLKEKNAERQWVADEIIFDFECGTLIDGRPIGDVWAAKAGDMTMRGARFLMDHGYIKPMKVVAYSSPWYFKNFKFGKLRQVLDMYDSIVATYFWNEKLGYRHVTFEGLVEDIKTIPDSWKPEYFGACKPGDVVLMEQISAAHTMDEVRNHLGKVSAVDVNVVRIGMEGMFARYPDFKSRYENRFKEKPPVVDPPPPPVEIPTKKVATVVSTANMRSSPAMTGNVIHGQSKVGTVHDVLDTKIVAGQTWRKVKVELEVWIADTTLDKKVRLLEVKDVPK